MKRLQRIRYLFAAGACLALGGYCARFPFRELYRLESSETQAAAADAKSDQTTSDLSVTLRHSFLGIPVREVSYSESKTAVRAGGSLIGLALQSKGLRILGSQFVETENGEVNTLANSDIKLNDLLIALNGNEVNTQEDISRILEAYEGNSIPARFLRNGHIVETTIGIARNRYNGKRALGLWVKDQMSGIGTMTFIHGDRFAALGHAVKDESGETFPTKSGALYPCELLGVQQGSRGVPGYIKGTFSYNAIKQGIIEKNTDYGLYGKVADGKNFELSEQTMPCCARQKIQIGKAQILSAVSGALRAYEIEIIKAVNQKQPRTKSMVIRVTDPDLIALTGGIVQGMSGSPIIQNGKFVGAVTHVFNSDATKGFALYGDWMLQEINAPHE